MGKKWLKLWTETLHDRKLRRVTPAWRWCWVGLLMLAADTDDEGKLQLTAGEPLTDEDIADELGVDLDEWTLARDYFMRIGMLKRSGAGLVVTNYTKRQEPADPTAAERMRRMRERNKRDDVTNVTRNVTGSVTRTLRVEAEAEAESEEMRDRPPTPPPPDPFPSSDPEWGAAISKLEGAGIGVLSGTVLLELSALWPDLTNGKRAWLDDAIAVAIANGAKSPTYAVRVLASAIRDGKRPGQAPAPKRRTAETGGNRLDRILGVDIHGNPVNNSQ